MKQIINTRFTMAVFAALLVFCSCSTRLHTGYYKTAVLVKKGYKVPADAPRVIYIKRTSEISKANIVKQ